MTINKNLYLIIGVVILVLVIAGVFVWWKYYKPIVSITTPKTEELNSLGGQIYEQVQNPAEKIPETNPFEKTPDINPASQTNPFKDIKTNPFR